MKPFIQSAAILHSKRANIYYLEHCRIIVRGGQVEYVTTQDRHEMYWNIPVKNTTFLLLGSGTSVTQRAIQHLAKAGVPVGFCGGGGTPLFAAVDMLWVTPQDEYRPTKYMQAWVKMWMDEDARLQAGKNIQLARLAFTKKMWASSRFKGQDFHPNSLDTLASRFENGIQSARNQTDLLFAEARMCKGLYGLAAKATAYQDFKRQPRKKDTANQYLDHGNYLAYGAGAVVAWVLGLNHSFSVLHGKTRRGGLVFDIADIVKDGIILPQAFISAARGDSRRDFRRACLDSLMSLGGLDKMFNVTKDLVTCL